MVDHIVTNTSPLLALAKMQAFDAIGRLPYKFLCPNEVEAEILAGAKPGQPLELPSWLQIVALKTPLSPLAVAALDAGEAAVIQLALEQSIPFVCIDERAGRRAALSVGLQVIGSLGLIGKAKTLGLLPAVRPLVEKARNAGIYYDTKLIEQFLRSLGE